MIRICESHGQEHLGPKETVKRRKASRASPPVHDIEHLLAQRLQLRVKLPNGGVLRAQPGVRIQDDVKGGLEL